MAKILIAYHSHSGRVRHLAGELASLLDADTDRIREVRPRVGGLVGNIAVSWDAVRKRVSAIHPSELRPTHYQHILLGTQVWAGNLPPPVRAYALANAASIARYSVFCSYGGRGAENVVEQIARIIGRPPLATVLVRQSLIKKAAYRPMLQDFVKELAEQGVGSRIA